MADLVVSAQNNTIAKISSLSSLLGGHGLSQCWPVIEKRDPVINQVQGIREPIFRLDFFAIPTRNLPNLILMF
jgi:hypothetical protein